MFVDLTMKLRESYSVLLELIGQTKSEYSSLISLLQLFNQRRIKQKLRTGELSVPGDQWPVFLYRSHQYDDTNPWKGLLQSEILVKVSKAYFFQCVILTTEISQTFKHIFTSPSSVDREAKATRSGNARIHGMSSVTRASIAYVATQVSFSGCCFCTFWEA